MTNQRIPDHLYWVKGHPHDRRVYPEDIEYSRTGGTQMSNRDGAAIVREYVEHDLDERYDGSTEVVLPMPPTGLIERIDDALRDATRTPAATPAPQDEKVAQGIVDKWVDDDRLNDDDLVKDIAESRATVRQQSITIGLKRLADAERLAIFSEYCKHCGTADPSCQCWNDE